MKKVLLFVAVAMGVALFSSCSKEGDTCMCRTEVGPLKGEWQDYSNEAGNKADCKALSDTYGGIGMKCEMRNK